MQSWSVILRCLLTIPRLGWLSLSATGRFDCSQARLFPKVICYVEISDRFLSHSLFRFLSHCASACAECFSASAGARIKTLAGTPKRVHDQKRGTALREGIAADDSSSAGRQQGGEPRPRPCARPAAGRVACYLLLRRYCPGALPVHRLKARWKAAGSAYPSRYLSTKLHTPTA